MLTKVQKWGNSLALRIPKSYAEEVHLEAESAVDLTVKNGQLVARPVPRKGFVLDELLAGVTPENRHGEIDTGPAVGLEHW